MISTTKNQNYQTSPFLACGEINRSKVSDIWVQGSDKAKIMMTSWWFQPILEEISQIGSFPQGSGRK